MRSWTDLPMICSRSKEKFRFGFGGEAREKESPSIYDFKSKIEDTWYTEDISQYESAAILVQQTSAAFQVMCLFAKLWSHVNTALSDCLSHLTPLVMTRRLNYESFATSSLERLAFQRVHVVRVMSLKRHDLTNAVRWGASAQGV